MWEKIKNKLESLELNLKDKALMHLENNTEEYLT